MKASFLKNAQLTIIASDAKAVRDRERAEREAIRAAARQQRKEKQAQKELKLREEVLAQKIEPTLEELRAMKTQKAVLDTKIKPMLGVLQRMKSDETGQPVFDIDVTRYTDNSGIIVELTPVESDNKYTDAMLLFVVDDGQCQYSYGRGFVPANCTPATLEKKILLWVDKHAPAELRQLVVAQEKRRHARAASSLTSCPA